MRRLSLCRNEIEYLDCSLKDEQKAKARIQSKLDAARRTIQDAYNAEDRVRDKLTRARRDLRDMQEYIEVEKDRHAQELSEKSSEIEHLQALYVDKRIEVLVVSYGLFECARHALMLLCVGSKGEY